MQVWYRSWWGPPPRGMLYARWWNAGEGPVTPASLEETRLSRDSSLIQASRAIMSAKAAELGHPVNERSGGPMTLVKNVMSTELVVVDPDLALRDLVELLANGHLSGAPVVTKGRVVGVVTLDDIASFLASSSPVPVDGEEESGGDEEPPPGVVEGEEAAGAFFQDLWADAGAELVERTAAIRGPEWDLLAEHSVEEAMWRRVAAMARGQG